MNLNKDLFKGSYIFYKGKFFPTGDMETINDMIKKMKRLVDREPFSYGYFHFNPQDRTYWYYIQQENYDTELKRVDREYIEKNFPTVDCDRLYDVDW